MVLLDEALSAAPIVAIVRLPGGADAVTSAAVVAAAGVRVLEVALTTPGALDAVERLRSELGNGVVVGVGSVREPGDVKRARDAGAQFLVTPTTRLEVLSAAVQAGMPVICGGITPTELDTAHSLGASYQKVFPASLAGPAYVREVLAPMPDLRLVPTGGVTIDQVAAYRDAGAVAVGVGSALIDAATVTACDWRTLTHRVAAFLAAWSTPSS